MTLARILIALALGLTPAAAETWVGTYTCSQGPTGLALHIQRDAQMLSGVFHFYQPAGHGVTSEGCFEVSGRIGRDEMAVLTPGRWLFRPAGYIAVGLEGRPGSSGGEFSGTVRGYGCTTFRLRMSAAAPSLPLACRQATGSSPAR